MNILAIETSSEYLSVALAMDNQIVYQDCHAVQRHSELLLPMIEEVLVANNVKRDQLSAIGFGAGPGSFTGLRIACGVAQGLAFGLDIPVIPISTLEVVAEATGQQNVAVALDARMGEIYFAAYSQTVTGRQTIIQECLCNPDQVFELPGENWFGAGSGFALYKEKLINVYGSKLVGITDQLFPHAQYIARLACIKFQQGLAVSPELALPTYIRDKVALTTQERSSV